MKSDIELNKEINDLLGIIGKLAGELLAGYNNGITSEKLDEVSDRINKWEHDNQERVISKKIKQILLKHVKTANLLDDNKIAFVVEDCDFDIITEEITATFKEILTLKK